MKKDNLTDVVAVIQNTPVPQTNPGNLATTAQGDLVTLGQKK